MKDHGKGTDAFLQAREEGERGRRSSENEDEVGEREIKKIPEVRSRNHGRRKQKGPGKKGPRGEARYRGKDMGKC